MIENRVLSKLDIEHIAQGSLLEYLPSAIHARYGLTIEIMLDIDDTPKQSLGMGKKYIAELARFPSYCHLVCEHINGVLDERCTQNYLEHFLNIKTQAMGTPELKCITYRCAPGGLRCFAMPIIEKGTKTFLGVLFGGHMRIDEGTNINQSLQKIIYSSDNGKLKNTPFKKILGEYRKVKQVSDDEFHEIEQRAYQIAEDICTPFQYLANIVIESTTEDKTLETVYEQLINAADRQSFISSLDPILNALQQWLRFDWCIVLGPREIRESEQRFEAVGSVGRGIGFKDRLIGKSFLFSRSSLMDNTEVKHAPEFLRAYIPSIASTQADWWWVPVLSRSNAYYGIFIFGSSPEHRNTQYNLGYIQSKVQRIQEISDRMATRLAAITSREREKRALREISDSRDQARELAKRLEDVVAGMTHQLKRPLILVEGALSTILRMYGHNLDNEVAKYVKWGLVAANHWDLLCKGISKALAHERGAQFDTSPTQIDVRSELMSLSEAMQSISGRNDLKFSYFQQAPKVSMDRDSFLYVFYVLIDNAIKYSDPGTTIEIGCDEEKSKSEYAFKIKSYGLPVPKGQEHRVFEKYWRADDAHEYDVTGIGLGCWAAKKHMDLNDGQLFLETNGKLTVFIVIPPFKKH